MPSNYPEHLTGPQHFARAEKLIQSAEDERNTSNPARSQSSSQLAMAHLEAARLAWDIGATLFDAGQAADRDDAVERMNGTVLAGWPEAVL